MSKEESEKLSPEVEEWERSIKEKKLRESAEQILSDMDLSLKDLEGKGVVVDLGAGTGDVGRAARTLGNEAVIAVAKEFPRGIEIPNAVKMDAIRNWGLKPGSVDLLLSHNGPHLWNYTEEEARQLFLQINEALAAGGEARLYVPWLGFIQIRIAKTAAQTEPLARELEKPTDWRAQQTLLSATPRKLEILRQFLRQAKVESTKFLQGLGYRLTLERNRKRPDEYGEYWLLKKSV